MGTLSPFDASLNCVFLHLVCSFNISSSSHTAVQTVRIDSYFLRIQLNSELLYESVLENAIQYSFTRALTHTHAGWTDGKRNCVARERKWEIQIPFLNFKISCYTLCVCVCAWRIIEFHFREMFSSGGTKSKRMVLLRGNWTLSVRIAWKHTTSAEWWWWWWYSLWNPHYNLPATWQVLPMHTTFIV